MSLDKATEAVVRDVYLCRWDERSVPLSQLPTETAPLALIADETLKVLKNNYDHRVTVEPRSRLQNPGEGLEVETLDEGP